MSKHPKLQAFNLNRWLDTNRERLVPPVNNQLLHDDSTGMIVMVIGGPNTRVDSMMTRSMNGFTRSKAT